MIERAADIARTLKGGEVFALMGDLGLGKTTFVKGLALGLKSQAIVTSPTFNLVHRYPGKKLQLVHYDLYRLKKFEEIEAIDLETELQSNHIIAIEWPQLVQNILPAKRTYWVEFQEISETKRKVSMTQK